MACQVRSIQLLIRPESYSAKLITFSGTIAEVVARKEKLLSNKSSLELKIKKLKSRIRKAENGSPESDDELDDLRNELAERTEQKEQAELEFALADIQVKLDDEEKSGGQLVVQFKDELSLATKRLKLHILRRDDPNNPDINGLQHEIQEADGAQDII